MIYEYWINGLLSGVKTHVVNITSNALVPLWQISERAVAGAGRAAVGGDGVELQEASYMLRGMVKGYRDGFRLAAVALKTGQSSDVLQKIETFEHEAITAKNLSATLLGKGINKVSGNALEKDGVIAKGVDLLGHTVRLPGRFLMAEDELFRTVGYRMDLHAQAARMAGDEGLSAEAFTDRVEEILRNPPDQMRHTAMDAGRYQTFTKELGETGKMLQKLGSKVPGGRVVAPFIRTPANIIKFFGERTPFALAHSGIRGDIAASGARRDIALARIGLGTMVMATMADLSLEGHVTGGGPVDKRQRQIWLDQGHLPYSVQIGDSWYSYNRLEPLGMAIGVAADTAEILSQAHDEDQAQMDELAGAAVLATVRNVSSKTWTQGATNLIAAIDSPNDAKMQYYLSGLAGSLVPAAVRQFNSDDVRRDSQGVVTEGGNRELDLWQGMANSIKLRIPGYSEDMPPRRNLWGDVVHYPEGLGSDFISPVSTSKQKQDTVNNELLRLRAPIGLPSKIVEGVRLSPKEYSRYIELAGKVAQDEEGRTLKLHLRDMFLSSEYKSVPLDTQAEVVRSIYNSYKAKAREMLKQESLADPDSNLMSLIMRRKAKENR